jgi:CBS domain-containing protein
MDPNKVVSEIMTKELVTVKPGDSFEVVKDIFENHSFHHLPVVNPGKKLLGIISKEDYLKVISFDFIQLNQESVANMLKARDVMTRYPTALDPTDSIGLAADIFMANKFHALPVVEDNELLGLITSHDLIAHAYKRIDLIAEEEFLEAE